MTERTEGWGVIRPGDRKAHYYRDGFSLCRRVGFYRGPLDPDTGKDSPDDHLECRRALRKLTRVQDRVQPEVPLTDPAQVRMEERGW